MNPQTHTQNIYFVTADLSATEQVAYKEVQASLKKEAEQYLLKLTHSLADTPRDVASSQKEFCRSCTKLSLENWQRACDVIHELEEFTNSAGQQMKKEELGQMLFVRLASLYEEHKADNEPLAKWLMSLATALRTDTTTKSDTLFMALKKVFQGSTTQALAVGVPRETTDSQTLQLTCGTKTLLCQKMGGSVYLKSEGSTTVELGFGKTALISSLKHDGSTVPCLNVHTQGGRTVHLVVHCDNQGTLYVFDAGCSQSVSSSWV